MKRLLLATLFLNLLAASASAQDYEVVDGPGWSRIDMNRVRFGAYFAPNVSWMKPVSAKSDNGLYRVTSGGSKVGYTWGLLADYFFTENYGIATGFQLNTTGGTIKTFRIAEDSTLNTVYNSNFNYTSSYI